MAFKRRGIVILQDEFTQDWLQRMHDAKLNVLGLHPWGGHNAHESLEDTIRMHNLPANKALRERAARMGICVEYELHAMRWLLPASLFKHVPEWFRMNEAGERTPDFNLCPSSPDALSYVAERARALALLLDTQSNRYYYWMDDVAGYACHCPKCAELSPSDQQMVVVNAMLTGVRGANPQAIMPFLAYADAMEAPTAFQPLPGVFLEYAPIRRDSHRPLNDPDCPQNVSETRSIEALLALFGTENAQVLEYWMDNTRFSQYKKPPKPLALEADVMRRDVEYFARLGFQSVTSFGCWLSEEYQSLYGEPPVKEYGEILLR